MRGVFEKSGDYWIRYAVNGKIRREAVTWKKIRAAGIKVHAETKQDKPGKQLAARLYAHRIDCRNRGEIDRTIALHRPVLVKDLVPALESDYTNQRRKSWKIVKLRLDAHLVPFFGAMAANEVTSAVIARYTDERRASPASHATINREFAILRRMFTLAYREQPRRVREVPYFPRLKESAPRQGFIEQKDYNALKSQATKPWLRAMLATAYAFGFRRSELLNLRVRQVDMLAATISLDHGSTKNDEPRIVKMTSEVAALISLCIVGKKNDDFVFTRETGSRILDFRGAWENLTANTDGLLFHDLRRSAVRNMIRAGVPEKVAMR